jgi:hypothetical protein
LFDYDIFLAKVLNIYYGVFRGALNLYPGGDFPIVTLDGVKNGYFVDLESDTEPGVDFTCVPLSLSTDAQWAGN